MAQEFKYAFTPLKLGPITVKNRIFCQAHTTRFTKEKALPDDRYVDYIRERARGGFGMIICGMNMVMPNAMQFPTCQSAWDPEVVPMFRKLADAVHEHGAKIFCQLGSLGQAMKDGGLQSKLPIWGPSPVRHTLPNTEMPKEMELEEIEEMIEYFGRSAENCREAGFDGIELHGAHGYLMNQFLSPYYNRRTDEYGGSPENRLRFLLRVIDRVKEVTGNEMALGVRLSGDDMVPGGLTINDTKLIAQRLEETGKVDYLSISIAPLFLYFASMYIPAGHLVPYAAEVKEVVKIPVFTAGRINDPIQAEKILDEGKADLICMGRALIVDPELPNKARQGKLDDIRPCTGCCQNCFGKMSVGLPVDCAQNPAVGKEKDWGADTLRPADRKKKVLVVGGGPGGLEAARVAALRGHEVVLYEREREMGGQINLAAKLPGRDEMDGFVRWRQAQIKKLGVNVVLEKEVTPEVVEQVRPDAVVLATGSTPLRVWEQENVVTVDQILRGEVEVGEKVVIQDEMFDIKAPGLALLLAGQGKQVEILTSPFVLGMNINIVTLIPVLTGLAQAGIKVTLSTMIKEISGETVTVFNVFTQQERKIEGVDTVVPIMGRAANDKLYKQLKGKVKELYRIGDCVAQRPVDRAIYDGHAIGREL